MIMSTLGAVASLVLGVTFLVLAWYQGVSVMGALYALVAVVYLTSFFRHVRKGRRGT